MEGIDGVMQVSDSYFREFRKEVSELSGLLRTVKYGVHRDLPTVISAVLLEFEAVSWLFTVSADDDTVRISKPGAGIDDSLTFSDPPAGSGWEPAIGAAVPWIWILENQQGYVDGVQIRFARDGAEAVTVQLLAGASHWSVRFLA